ncbi:MAG: ABC transporter ATP-binding protein [Candidatus Cloacimonadales bacterium]
MALVKTVNVTKKFKDLLALDNVNAEVKKGRIVGLVGKNGAGKSTLMKCIIGFSKFEGEIFIDDQEIKYMDHKIFEDTAFIPDINSLDGRMKVKALISFFRGVHPKFNDERFDKLFATSNLPLDKKISKLSKGMKTKLYLILILSLDVSFLILDEPTLGLDIVYRSEFYNTILSSFYNENRTVLISTHQVEEIEHILHDLIIIDQGKILVNDTIDNLLTYYKLITIDAKDRDKLEGIPHKVVTEGLSAIEVVVPRKADITGFKEAIPNLAHIFLYTLENQHETV